VDILIAPGSVIVGIQITDVYVPESEPAEDVDIPCRAELSAKRKLFGQSVASGEIHIVHISQGVEIHAFLSLQECIGILVAEGWIELVQIVVAVEYDDLSSRS
jgi:hypothetical protein